jgi:hypothetical protein
MAAAIRLSQQHSCSFDHLVGDSQQPGRDGEAERLGSLDLTESSTRIVFTF